MPYKVAVLMGGSSFERDFSLASGRNVLRTLEHEGHTVLPLDTAPTLVDILRNERPDVAYIALHGRHGEDGTIQTLLEYLDIPYVGSSSSVCRTTWNKAMLPLVVRSHRQNNSGPANWPRSVCLSAVAFKNFGAASVLDLITERIPSAYPLAVLPASGGSAMGVTKVESFESLAPAILEALSFDDEVLIEEWIDGVELAVCVIGGGTAAHALPSVEIRPKNGFFGADARLDHDLAEYYVPARSQSLAASERVAERVRALVETTALEVHRAFGCRDLSRVDMIWDGEKTRVLEINVSPGMTEFSLFPMACRAANLPLGVLLNRLLDAAVARG
ncbi:MAG: D-alanine--D-alanine ligase [Coriobacteriales bacterium]|jgi:D-alanine-D-alanine ligase|nr:D-alanine--D-alanine ligase [Coriobacteriales bacterium]